MRDRQVLYHIILDMLLDEGEGGGGREGGGGGGKRRVAVFEL